MLPEEEVIAAEMRVVGFVRKPVSPDSEKGKLIVETWEGVWETEQDSIIHQAPHDVLVGIPPSVRLVLERLYPLPDKYLPYAEQAELSRVLYHKPARSYYSVDPRILPPVFWVLRGIFAGQDGEIPLEDVVRYVGPVLLRGKLDEFKQEYDPYAGYFVEKIVTQTLGYQAGWGKKPSARNDYRHWCRLYYDAAKGQRVSNLHSIRKADPHDALLKEELASFVRHLGSDVTASCNGFTNYRESLHPSCYRMGGTVEDLNRILGLHALFHGKYAYRENAFYDDFIRKVHRTQERTFKKWASWPHFCDWLRMELRSKAAKQVVARPKKSSHYYGPQSRRYRDGFSMYPPPPRRRRKRVAPPLPEFVDDVKHAELLSAQGMLR